MLFVLVIGLETIEDIEAPDKGCSTVLSNLREPLNSYPI